MARLRSLVVSLFHVELNGPLPWLRQLRHQPKDQIQNSADPTKLSN